MYSFPQIDPETSGQVTQIPIPLDKYLGAAYSEGDNDSALNSIMRMREIGLDNADETSPMLTPEDANAKYAVGDLKFDQPVRDITAATMSERKKSEMDRQFYMTQGASGGRFLPGMAASVMGGMNNPLDIGLMFIPYVGEEKAAATIAEAGGGAVRQALARGLITTEQLGASGVPVPQLMSHVLQGAISQAPYEILNLAASAQDKADYTVSDALRNIIGTGTLAGALHGVGSLLRRISPDTGATMMKEGMNQFLNDESPDVAKYISLDEAAIQQKVKFDDDAAKYQALGSIDEDKLKQQIFDQYHEKVVAPAMMLEDGRIIKGNPGEVHLDLLRHLSDDDLDKMSNQETVEGFLTQSGRFVSREEAASLMGMRSDFYASENIFNKESMDWMSEEEFDHANKQMENGKSKTDAINSALALREQNKRQFFFDRPDIQQKMNEERQRQINQFVETARQNYDPKTAFTKAVLADIKEQQAQGRILTPELIQKYLPADKNFESQSSQIIAKDVDNLKQNLDFEDPNSDFKQYMNLKDSLKGKNLDEAQKIMKEIEAIKNKYDGMPPKESASGITPEEQKILDDVPKPQGDAIDAALDCLTKKIV